MCQNKNFVNCRFVRAPHSVITLRDIFENLTEQILVYNFLGAQDIVVAETLRCIQGWNKFYLHANFRQFGHKVGIFIVHKSGFYYLRQ